MRAIAATRDGAHLPSFGEVRRQARRGVAEARRHGLLPRRRRRLPRLRTGGPWALAALAVVSLGLLGLASQGPELRRYMKMRRM